MRASVLLSVVALIGGCGALPNAVRERPIDEGIGRTSPTLSNYGADAVRIAVEPTFGDYAWRVELYPLPRDCITDLAAIDEALNKQLPVRYCKLAQVVAARLGRHASAPTEATTVRFRSPATSTFGSSTISTGGLIAGEEATQCS